MKKLEQWKIDYIREHKNDYPRKKVCEVVGASERTVLAYVRKFGGRIKALRDPVPPETKVFMSEQRKAIFRSEMRRFMSGEPQRTKTHLRIVPPKTRQALWKLCMRYNYFQGKRGDTSLRLYYDAETRRAESEAYFTKKYGIKFVAADDEEENNENSENGTE